EGGAVLPHGRRGMPRLAAALDVCASDSRDRALCVVLQSRTAAYQSQWDDAHCTSGQLFRLVRPVAYVLTQHNYCLLTTSTATQPPPCHRLIASTGWIN